MQNMKTKLFFSTIKSKQLVLLSAASLLAAAACKKDNIDTYTGANFIQFETPYTDTLRVAFFLYPQEDVLSVKIPVAYIGQMTSEDTPIALAINKEETTLDADVYTLEATPTLKKGQAQDSILLEVQRSPKIKDKEFKLVIDLQASDRLQVGETLNSRKVIVVSDRIVRPQWWDATMESSYLGKYSDAKYSKFIEVVGEGDLEKFSLAEQRDMMLQFKYYLIAQRDKGTPVKEADGSDMLNGIPLIG